MTDGLRNVLHCKMCTVIVRYLAGLASPEEAEKAVSFRRIPQEGCMGCHDRHAPAGAHQCLRCAMATALLVQEYAALTEERRRRCSP